MLLKKLLVSSILLNTLCHCLLFQEGTYKTKKKGQKKKVTSVDNLEPGKVPDTLYLRINAVVPRLYSQSVRNFQKLEDLTLSSCGILEIDPGAFQNVPNLSRLNLKENAIEHVRSGVFNKLNVSVIFLNKNEIKTIDSDAFDNMPLLMKIKLNSNKITKWDVNWFKNTPLLNHLSFRRNLLEDLPDFAFKHVPGWHLIRGKEVVDTRILLSKNKISTIHPKAFFGLKKLGQLWLDRNQITVLDPALFSDFEIIRMVILAKNNLTEIPEKLFDGVRVNNLDVSGNRPLRCLPQDVVKIVSKVVVKGIRKIDCHCIARIQDQTKKIIKSDCN